MQGSADNLTGSRIVSLDDIMYKSTPGDIPEDRIVFPDLVETLKLDPNKYLRPGVDYLKGRSPIYVVTLNSIFLKAAKEAGLGEMVVNGPFDSEVETKPCSGTEIINNYVFFDNPRFDDSEIAGIFDGYDSECQKRMAQPLERSAKIFSHHKVHAPDILAVKIVFEEGTPYRQLLHEINSTLYKRLEASVGDIRSVNGIRPMIQQ